MAVEADQSFAPLSPAKMSADRERAIRVAHRHSRHVRILRILLPVCSLAIMAFYFLSSNFTVSIGDIEASVSRTEITKDRLRMVDPKLEGVTDDKGAYMVSADYAEQELSNPSVVQLHKVRAELNNATKGWTRMTSPEGVFDTTKEALVLTGDIQVGTSSGLTSALTRAAIDMKTQIITSPEPVAVTFPSGTLDSSTMHINMSTKEISFDGDVRVRTQPPPKKAGAQPAASAAPYAMSLDRNKPIDIAAPHLTIFDAVKLAHFTGGVTTEQDGARMQSNEMKIFYEKDKAAPNEQVQQESAQGGTKLRQIEAIGGVVITAADGRRATGHKLTYEAGKQRITFDRNVTLSQAGNKLQGARMISDLATSITRFPGPGRVKGRFAALPSEKPKPKVEPSTVTTAKTSTGQFDLSSTRGKPIDIEADTLVVNDAKKAATFDGDVKALQGGMTLQSRALSVFYGGDTGAEGKGAEISRIRAEGPVLITTVEKQTVTSDWVVFEATKETVTIGGNVVLSQGENVIKGDRLVIDLKTGRSRFENDGDVTTGKRVQGLFIPKQFKKKEKEKEKEPAQ